MQWKKIYNQMTGPELFEFTGELHNKKLAESTLLGQLKRQSRSFPFKLMYILTIPCGAIYIIASRISPEYGIPLYMLAMLTLIALLLSDSLRHWFIEKFAS